MRHLPRYLLPSILLLLLIAAMLHHGPIAQTVDYHHFADQRGWLGMSNVADVLSNLGFAMCGLWGLSRLRAHPNWVSSARVGYTLFFYALILTAIGSSWYHLAPDNTRLIFDRIPIAIACVALLAATWQECYGCMTQQRRDLVLCAVLTLLAIGSVLWWRYTDLHANLQQAGDLRPYLLLQVLPLLMIPLLHWQAGINRAKRLAFGAAIVLYILAKITELQDHHLFAQLGYISGHTLKHLLATAAAAVLAWQIGVAARR